jgi:hypothetical protein
MSQEREREFEELRAFVDFYATHVHGVDPASPIHVSAAVQEITVKFGRSKALVGLRQAANDTIEATSNLPPEQVAQLDNSLRAQGVLTLSEVRHRYSTAYRRILRRGSIKTETEYYLVNGIVVHNTSSLTNAERQSLEQMLAAYESGG